MPKELITERRDHGRDEPISAALIEWGPWQEVVEVRVTADCRPPTDSRDYSSPVQLNNRESINAMIRALKKARDQAFGKDE